MSEFGWGSTTDEVLDGKDLSGMTVFITGANCGLGQETARAMAAKSAHVVMAGRDQAKLDEAVAAIFDTVPDAKLDTITLDLGSLESIRAATSRARQRFDKIDILINNAGVMATPFEHTHDGFERQFGTNHLGHFALTAELMPLIERGSGTKGGGRIVNLSSRGHHMGPVHFEDPHYQHRAYDPWSSYGQSKTANVLFTVGLEQRFAVLGIHAYAVHPGGIETNLGRHMTPEMRDALMARISSRDTGFAWKTIPQGAATSCWAATAEALEGKGGVYCEDCHVAPIDDESASGGVRTYALNPSFADQLWKLSEELTGAKFPS